MIVFFHEKEEERIYS